jgi:hypothetical protein
MKGKSAKYMCRIALLYKETKILQLHTCQVKQQLSNPFSGQITFSASSLNG